MTTLTTIAIIAVATWYLWPRYNVDFLGFRAGDWNTFATYTCKVGPYTRVKRLQVEKRYFGVDEFSDWYNWETSKVYDSLLSLTSQVALRHYERDQIRRKRDRAIGMG